MPRVREFTEELIAFWRERHLCTVTTLRTDGSPHVVPMGIALADQIPDHTGAVIAWGITSRTSRKVANLRGPDRRIAICQVDGARWCTLEGVAEVCPDEATVAEAVRCYAGRYRLPRENPERVAIRITVGAVVANVPRPEGST